MRPIPGLAIVLVLTVLASACPATPALTEGAPDYKAISQACDAGQFPLALTSVREQLPNAMAGTINATIPDADAWMREGQILQAHGVNGYDRALRLYGQALGAFTRDFDQALERAADALARIGRLHTWMGKSHLALVELNCALVLSERNSEGVSPAVGIVLAFRAETYQNLSDPDAARQDVARGLAAADAWPAGRQGTKALLLSIDASLQATPDAALARYRQVLQIDEALDLERRGSLAIAIAHDRIGECLMWKREYGQAMLELQKSLEFKMGDTKETAPDTIATTLNSIADVYIAQHELERAIPLYRQAVHITYHDPTDLSTESATLSRLAIFSESLADALAQRGIKTGGYEEVFYLKLAVNASQRMRQGAQGLDLAARERLTRSLTRPYERLARLYVAKGQIVDAERVLRLLKESELESFLEQRGVEAASPQPLAWSSEEQAYQQELAQAAADWNEFLKKWQEVSQQVRDHELTTQSKRWLDLLAKRDQIEQQISLVLGRASDQLDEASRRAAKLRQDSLESARSELSETLNTLRRQATPQTPGQRTVALLLLPGPADLIVIAVDEAGAVALPAPTRVTEAELSTLVAEFRRGIVARQNVRKLSEQLHTALIKPAEEMLQASSVHGKADQIAILAYGSLRDLPFAALRNPADGRYLVQSYPIAMLTANGNGSYSELTNLPEVHWQGAALGMTKPAATFSNVALPHVRDEVCGIVKGSNYGACGNIEGTIDGQPLLNDDFTASALKGLLDVRPVGDRGPNFLHIATHYRASDATILIGDGSTLSSAEIMRWRPLASRYDLVTLSACDSGLEEGGVESLGGIFRRRGARSVLASLWPVADVGAAPFMIEFYRQIGNPKKQTKAQALRAAQLSMIQSKASRDKGQADMSKPYFWAPYVLMGNWL